MSVVHERNDEEPEGVVDEGERERGESEGAKGSVAHGRGERMGTRVAVAAENTKTTRVCINYAGGAWAR